MFRKIVISVLAILASVIASAGIADLAGWGPVEFSCGKRSDGYETWIGVFGSTLIAIDTSPPCELYDAPFVRSWMGIGYARPTPSSDHIIMVSCPFWIPVLILAAYPTLAFIRDPRRRWNRRRHDLCLRCGYNLEGNVSGVCPECGMATQV